MGSELCKTCIHPKVCMKDKNLVGDVFVMGHPMMFDNDKLYEEYKEREKQGFPCEDYMPSAKKDCFNCKFCDYEIEMNEFYCTNENSEKFKAVVDTAEDNCDKWEQSAIRWYKEEDEQQNTIHGDNRTC